METYLVYYPLDKATVLKNMIRGYESVASQAGYDRGQADALAIDAPTYYEGFTAGKNSVQQLADIQTAELSAYADEIYITRYEEGALDFYNSGSEFFDYDLTGSIDYLDGFNDGSALNVNVGASTFMVGFEKWIVPAILLVLLLGGFTSVYAMKQRGE